MLIPTVAYPSESQHPWGLYFCYPIVKSSMIIDSLGLKQRLYGKHRLQLLLERRHKHDFLILLYYYHGNYK
jgi:hypothetical protein